MEGPDGGGLEENERGPDGPVGGGLLLLASPLR